MVNVSRLLSSKALRFGWEVDVGRLAFIGCFVALRAFGQCDPAGVVPPPFPEAEVPIELELFKDELAARGVCGALYATEQYARGYEVLLRTAERQSLDLRCNGVCEPMRQKLGPLDETHDLEDLTFQKECRAATKGLPAPCLRVCVVERRRVGARAVFGRTQRMLELSLPYRGQPLDPKNPRAALNGAQPAPSSVRFDVVGEKNERHVRADGWLYPGGPRVRLQTALMSAGCGQQAWGVTTW